MTTRRWEHDWSAIEQCDRCGALYVDADDHDCEADP